jgi:hypothetical protein
MGNQTIKTSIDNVIKNSNFKDAHSNEAKVEDEQ